MERKQKILLSITAPILLTCFLYVSGIIAQFLRNYSVWQSQGAVGSPALPSLSLYEVIKAIFTIPYGLIGITATIVLILIILFGVLHMGASDGEVDQERNFTYSESGSYGTAG